MGRRVLPAVTTGAVLALALGWLPLGAPPAAAAPATRHVDHLTLVKQSPWVGPKVPNQDLTMSLRIQSSAPRDALKLSFTVYHPLSTRSAFDETLSGKGLGSVIALSPGLALSGFSTDVQGVTDVTIPVDGDTTPTGTGNWTADLGCQSGSCANVYPIKVTLSDSSGSGAQLVSYLVYDDPSATSEPLRLALVVPLGLGPPTADDHGHVPAPSPAGLSKLEGLLSALAGAPLVPVTLAPDAATLDQLAVTGHGHTVGEVAGLSGSSTRQTLAGPFVPVDAGALVGAGLPGELAAQLQRGDDILGSGPIGVHATKGTWVARTPLDQDAVDQLSGEDAHLVVPPGSVSGPTGPLTVTQPFTLTPAPGSTSTGPAPTGMVSDGGLDERLNGAQGADPALAAEQLLAEASLIYYEVPNLRGPGGTPAVRGVVVVPPAAWAPSAAFVSSLLSGLVGNPVVEPVTVDQLFAEVAVGADREATSRHVVTPTTGGVEARTARAIRAARARQSGFASAVAGSAAGATTAQVTDDLLLAAESSLLSGHQQQAGLAGFNTALDQRLRGLGVRSDTIRLTAGTASVPITLLRNTGYPVTVVVKLTSDKLRFPVANTQLPGAICKAPHVRSSAGRSSFSALCTLDHATNAVYVDMSARASGDFAIHVALESPEGNLVLAGGQLTVRSLSTSAVAIALSVGAVLVLFFWWGRTLWRGKKRRGAHTVARVRGPVA
ncbi:MAG TPA: DUF6049 family protein [Acidimicrobiales bacterium]|nr:DUF6049 family protein [Acidimicrobiales bacterium]